MAPLALRYFVSLDVGVFPRRYFGGTSRLCREVLFRELPVHEIVQESLDELRSVNTTPVVT